LTNIDLKPFSACNQPSVEENGALSMIEISMTENPAFASGLVCACHGVKRMQGLMMHLSIPRSEKL
jgi:hypothetical protein